MNVLITGGAGFIGINTAAYYLKKGANVTIYDNLSRDGSNDNLSYIRRISPHVGFVQGDLRDESKLQKVVKGQDVIFHFAAQVAVTSSVENPREDFEINALGTFNLLEAVRQSKSKAILLYSSTNKVYGGLEDVAVIEQKTRYAFKNLPFGVSEQRNLDFHSPYGCSKGAADQYVRDYARIYGLRTVVFRQSCIYGPHQHGVEDQGWVAWFLLALADNKPFTIYGDGKQVRDLLYIDDLMNAYDLAIRSINKTAGDVYNIGGGQENTLSVWIEFKPILEKLFKKTIDVPFANWRPGDQKIFVSDIRKAKRDFGWEPNVGVEDGIRRLYDWIQEERKIKDA